jgi:F0F1-type ATP synthase assembly protein I
MFMSGLPAEVEIQKVLTSVRIGEWLLQDLFHTKWWLLLGLSILGVVVWWRFIDKRRLPEIILLQY